MKSFTAFSMLSAIAASVQATAIEERQFNLPKCPDNQPLVPYCRQWQVQTCVQGWEPWMSQTYDEYVEYCTLMSTLHCTTRCFSEQPGQPGPGAAPWPIPDDGCLPEGPVYQDCYNVGIEWCLTTESYWGAVYCRENNCPEWCHDWMDRACRRACNVDL